MTEGLRERKKQRTREAIIDAAMRLFADRGFEDTTIADIAAAADIAPRTFFAYFPAKEDVVFAEFAPRFAEFRARLLDARQPGESAFDALRGWVVSVIAAETLVDERHECRRELIRDNPTIAARQSHLKAQLTAVMTEAVARDLGVEPDDTRALMVAAAAAAALHTLGDTAARHADPLAVLDEALVFLRGGIEALQAADRVGEASAA